MKMFVICVIFQVVIFFPAISNAASHEKTINPNQETIDLMETLFFTYDSDDTLQNKKHIQTVTQFAAKRYLLFQKFINDCLKELQSKGEISYDTRIFNKPRFMETYKESCTEAYINYQLDIREFERLIDAYTTAYKEEVALHFEAYLMLENYIQSCIETIVTQTSHSENHRNSRLANLSFPSILDAWNHVNRNQEMCENDKTQFWANVSTHKKQAEEILAVVRETRQNVIGFETLYQEIFQRHFEKSE